jgi:UDP-glucose 4-epimerase
VAERAAQLLEQPVAALDAPARAAVLSGAAALAADVIDPRASARAGTIASPEALYARLHGLSTVSLRYGNVYGPRQDPLGEAGVIAIFCGKLTSGERPMVFGTGEQTRDYVFVGDVVSANLAAASSDAYGPFNIGTGRQTSVLDLVEALKAFADGSFEAEFAPERPGEVQHIALDYTRAREELGWEPKVDLNDGLATTLESVRATAQS